MELRPTKEQEAIRDLARRFAATEVRQAVAAMERDKRFPQELFARLKELGLTGIPVPQAWGGRGADFVSYTMAVHELSKESAALGVILSVHTSVATLPILRYGTDEQRERFVRPLAGGALLGAFALTEPWAGSDAGSIRTSAVRNGDEYVLNGTKTFITNAGAADLYVVFAVTDPSRGTRGITAFVVGKDAEGFKIGPNEKKMGLHGSQTCCIVLDNVRLPAEQRLGEEGQGFSIAMGSLDGGRIGIAAQSLGIAEAALGLMCEAALPKADGSKARRAVPVGAPQAELAYWIEHVEAARLFVYRAAALRQEGKPCTKEASMAKLLASDTAVGAAGAAVRMLGGSTRPAGQTAARLFRDAKVTQIYEGTNEIHRIVISGQLMKKGGV